MEPLPEGNTYKYFMWEWGEQLGIRPVNYIEMDKKIEFYIQFATLCKFVIISKNYFKTQIFIFFGNIMGVNVPNGSRLLLVHGQFWQQRSHGSWVCRVGVKGVWLSKPLSCVVAEYRWPQTRCPLPRKLGAPFQYFHIS